MASIWLYASQYVLDTEALAGDSDFRSLEGLESCKGLYSESSSPNMDR